MQEQDTPATDTPDGAAAKAQAEKEAVEAEAKLKEEPAPTETPPFPPTSEPVGAEPESFPSKPSPVALEKLAEIAFYAHNATYREGDTIDPERVQELLNDVEIAAWLKAFRDRAYPWRWKHVGPC